MRDTSRIGGVIHTRSITVLRRFGHRVDPRRGYPRYVSAEELWPGPRLFVATEAIVSSRGYVTKPEW